MDEEKKYWVALTTNIKIGSRTLMKLFKYFKNVSRVWEASERDFYQAGIEFGQIKNIREVIKTKDPGKEYAKLAKYKIDVLILPDLKYPKLLKELPDPPGILYVRGKILPEDELTIAVVGSRKFTPYGQEATQRLVLPLAKQKITIVSGLALGIDTLAHRAALEAGGRTIAVLGCGLNMVYPLVNTGLADKIIQSGGAIISEYPLGTPALRFNFPLRNRIIAGMSLGTLVIEAGINSGSLLTATAAIEYNREVFAVPGSIFSEASEGTNKLLKMGAKQVTSYQDILEELNIETAKQHLAARQILPDSPEEENLLKLLETPQTIDKLVENSGLNIQTVNTVLIEMEMKGKVRNMGGTQYRINGILDD